MRESSVCVVIHLSFCVMSIERNVHKLLLSYPCMNQLFHFVRCTDCTHVHASVLLHVQVHCTTEYYNVNQEFTHLMQGNIWCIDYLLHFLFVNRLLAPPQIIQTNCTNSVEKIKV